MVVRRPPVPHHVYEEDANCEAFCVSLLEVLPGVSCTLGTLTMYVALRW